MKLQAEVDGQALLGTPGPGRSLLRFSKGQSIFAQGDAADCVYFLAEGRVKVLVYSAQGKEVVTGIVEPGEFFGTCVLIGEETRSATTIAMQDCLITAIATTWLTEALRTQPKFVELFVSHLLMHNQRIEQDLRDQLLYCSEKRLARLLLRLAVKNGDPQPITIPISQETLAEMIGTTRSRVSYFMNKFRKAGLISYDGTIKIYPDRLNAMLQDQADVGP